MALNGNEGNVDVNMRKTRVPEHACDNSVQPTIERVMCERMMHERPQWCFPKEPEEAVGRADSPAYLGSVFGHEGP